MLRLMLALVLVLAACGGGEPTVTDPPTPKPTPEITEAPSPAPVPLPVTVAKLTKTVAPGGTASITVHTNAGAACGISVAYESGESTAEGLDAKTSNAKGDVTWRWLVGRKTNPQTIPVTVWCEKNGRTGGATEDVTVP